MYTYYDAEVDTSFPWRKALIIAALVGFLVVVLIILGVGLTRGEELSFTEYEFRPNSTYHDPPATCLTYHRDVISTMDLYNEFRTDCGLIVNTDIDSDFFQQEVVVLYFVNDLIVDQAYTFFDYPFMVDGHEVITVKEQPWTTVDDAWYIYYVYMTKDQIDSSEIVFD